MNFVERSGKINKKSRKLQICDAVRRFLLRLEKKNSPEEHFVLQHVHDDVHKGLSVLSESKT